MTRMEEIKSLIRSIVLALGRQTNEREFKKEFAATEGESFDTILKEFQMSFFEFMSKLNDVCRVWIQHGEIMIERVASKETAHMNHLTIGKKIAKIPRFRPGLGRSFMIHRPKLTGNFNQGNGNQIRPQLTGNFNQRNIYQMKQQPTIRLAYHRPTMPVISNNMKTRFSHKTATEMRPASYKPVSELKTVCYKPQHQIEETNGKTTENEKTDRIQETKVKTKENVKTDAAKSDWKQHQLKPVFNRSFFTVDNPFEAALRKITDSYKTKSSSPILSDTNPFKVQTKPKESETHVNKVADNFSKLSISMNDCNMNNRKEGKVLIPNALIKSALSDIKKQSINEEPSTKNNAVEFQDYITTAFYIRSPSLNVNIAKGFKVKIINVTSPSQFVFQVDEDELLELTEEMNIHYVSLRESAHLRVEKALLGLPVAVLEDDQWLRGEIFCIIEHDAVVFLVDYGIKRYFKLDSLRYLKKIFAYPSRKSCEGELTGVNPNIDKGLWSVEAIDYFIKKTKDAELYATIRNASKFIYELEIFKNDKKLSDILVSSGLALVK